MFLYPMEPHKMSYRFSEEDRLLPLDGGEGHTKTQKMRVQEALRMLPKRERDMLEMYIFRGKGQAEIGRLFSVTQGDVSYRIYRSIERLKFYLSLPRVCTRRMASDLMRVLKDPLYVSIMILMFHTTSQTAVANKIEGMTQGKIRYRYLKSLDLIREAAKAKPIYRVYVHIFDKISSNFNILRSLDTQERWAEKFEEG